MRILLLSLFVSVALSQSAAAQTEPSKEQTFQEIARALADIEEIMPSQDLMPTLSRSTLQGRLNDALERANKLKDYLGNNPYVRVSGVTVGFPWGISVEFQFK